MTKAFEFTEYHRNDLLYHFSTMTTEEVSAKRSEVDVYNKEQEAKKPPLPSEEKSG